MGFFVWGMPLWCARGRNQHLGFDLDCYTKAQNVFNYKLNKNKTHPNHVNMDISFIESFWKNGGTLKNLASLVLRVSFAKRLFLSNPFRSSAGAPWSLADLGGPGGRRQLTWEYGHAFSLGQAELRIRTRYLAEKDGSGGMWKGRGGLQV